ncbi:MAG TPA: CHAT domain-containing protein [Roseiflexaceae bacterium]|nr:CHAT domain-containing protein [Roseiflexaceae bacterium]
MKSYIDFEILIGVLDGTRFRVTVSGPGGEAQGYFELPDDDGYAELNERLQRLDTDEAILMQIGQVLFRRLFAGPIKDVYVRSQGALSETQGLRLRLNIPASEILLTALPWELLYDPDQGPLALLDAPIIRFLPQQDKVPSLKASLPLKVLLTGAQTPPAIDVEREFRAVQEALRDMGDLVQITVEPHLTVARLQQLLREEFHIWHFVGHGGFTRDGTTGQLVLEDADGDPEPVSALQLGIMLNRSGLRLVVLDACSGAQLATDAFRSVAPALIRAQIPAVVAMQFKVPEEATRAFAREFYGALAGGYPIDACMTEGRRAVMSATGLGRADWGTPVVYTRAPDGRLFDPPDQIATPIETTIAAVGQSAGSGLAALGELMQTQPAIRDAVFSFRADFQASGAQLDLLATYKDIHDQLHSLQFHCYNQIVQESRRLPDDDLAWENLVDHELTLQGVIEQCRAIADRSEDVNAEIAWVNDLEQARQDLHTAIESMDLRQLKRAVRLINRVLTIQPSQVNMRLNAAARALRLRPLAQGLEVVRAGLPATALQLERVQQFEVGVVALSSLSSELADLVESHDRWQALDFELRRIESLVDQDIEELDLSWPDIKQMATNLCQHVADGWAAALLGDAEKLEAALEAEEATRVKHFFRRFRRQAGDRFYRIDVDLKRMCDELRKVGEPLASVLRMMA